MFSVCINYILTSCTFCDIIYVTMRERIRKTINVAALVVIAWLIVDALNVPEALINFIVIGQLPMTKTSLPPSLMLAIMVASFCAVVFEVVSRRNNTVRAWRKKLFSTIGV